MAYHRDILSTLGNNAHVLNQIKESFKPLLESIGDASVVLLGEATHGTHEFYHARAQISQLLIEEKGFTTIAIEGDWPDAYSVNRYIYQARLSTKKGTESEALKAFADFERFPSWMWRNTQVLEFILWLYAHNIAQPARDKVGFYGLDLYSMHRSIQAVIDYLEKVDPKAARQARQRYDCLTRYASDPQKYGYFAALSDAYACQEEVTEQLIELQRMTIDQVKNGGFIAEDELFCSTERSRGEKC